jgi:hypothetical protein
MTTHLSSVTRIAHLPEDLPTRVIPSELWRSGDYVLVAAVGHYVPNRRVELSNGRLCEIDHGDRMVGALGVRAATTEHNGSYQAVGADNELHLLTPAGLLGALTSTSPFIGGPQRTQNLGHVLRDGEPIRMVEEVVTPPDPGTPTPVILVVGSAMSSGKTATARVIIRRLDRLGFRVGAAKLCGAARYRDALSFKDAGAKVFYDFVDAGLPSTICEPEFFEQQISGTLARLDAYGLDVLVVEAGASPLEPYNGDTVVRMLRDRVVATILCATDPYSVVGVLSVLSLEPDLISGLATNTEAARSLVERLSGIRARRLVHSDDSGELDAFLTERLTARE